MERASRGSRSRCLRHCSGIIGTQPSCGLSSLVISRRVSGRHRTGQSNCWCSPRGTVGVPSRQTIGVASAGTAASTRWAVCIETSQSRTQTSSVASERGSVTRPQRVASTTVGFPAGRTAFRATAGGTPGVVMAIGMPSVAAVSYLKLRFECSETDRTDNHRSLFCLSKI